MKIHCEICGLRDGDKMRIGAHTVLAEVENIALPLTSSMFLSPNPKRGIPAPFQGVDDWKHMKCPRCARVPFMFLPDDLDRYNQQGGPDRIYTDEGWVKLEKVKI